MRAELNSPTYLAGLWSKGETALVHPAKLASELARACRELGVEIFEHSGATSLAPTAGGGHVVVHTDKGQVTARQGCPGDQRVSVAAQAQPAFHGAGL